MFLETNSKAIIKIKNILGVPEPSRLYLQPMLLSQVSMVLPVVHAMVKMTNLGDHLTEK